MYLYAFNSNVQITHNTVNSPLQSGCYIYCSAQAEVSNNSFTATSGGNACQLNMYSTYNVEGNNFYTTSSGFSASFNGTAYTTTSGFNSATGSKYTQEIGRAHV